MAVGDARLMGSKVNTVIAITIETIFITAVIHGQGETFNMNLIIYIILTMKPEKV